MGYIKKIISSSPFALLIINVEILSNFQMGWTYKFGRKKGHLKKTKNDPLLRFECFEHAILFFLICVKF
jgi:hypothetical protein